VYVVPRGNGLYMVGATMIETGSAGPITARSMMELLNAAYALHPAFGEAEIVETGVGIRPAYPDNLPRVSRDGGMISVNGLHRHGFLLAPSMAQRAAELVFNRQEYRRPGP
ncbi:MAG TPA: FAD-dependent oxidoreductase, partial [Thalassobaculum sp.]